MENDHNAVNHVTSVVITLRFVVYNEVFFANFSFTIPENTWLYLKWTYSIHRFCFTKYQQLQLKRWYLDKQIPYWLKKSFSYNYLISVFESTCRNAVYNTLVFKGVTKDFRVDPAITCSRHVLFWRRINLF